MSLCCASALCVFPCGKTKPETSAKSSKFDSTPARCVIFSQVLVVFFFVLRTSTYIANNESSGLRLYNINKNRLTDYFFLQSDCQSDS